MAKSKLNCLMRAELERSYLETNATTHEFLFGALAEIVDNARDAHAENLHIYTESRPELRGGFILCFKDDGCGMTPNDVTGIVVFGRSEKKLSNDLIGRYGNGLKSGSMRLGKDLIVLTKKDGIMTALLVSQTFLDKERTNIIYTPMPSFHETTKIPWIDENSSLNKEDALEKHNYELEIIQKFSPFASQNELFDYFDKITTKSGTIVIIFNLKLADDEPELDIESNPHDIMMRNFRFNPDDRHSQMEHGSFRAYVSLLYADPKMRVFIQGKRVHTRILKHSLYKPLTYKHTSTKFKNLALKERDDAKREVDKLMSELKEAESELSHFQQKANKKDANYQVELTKLRRKKEALEKHVADNQKIYELKKKVVDAPKHLEFTFGVNIQNRDADGLFIYNCNRLLIMHEHTRPQHQNRNEYRGIVGVVNVPYYILEPGHNKQHFKEAQEKKLLITALSEHMDQYKRDLGKDLDSNEFWKEFGYFGKQSGPPLNDDNFVKRRFQCVKPLMQCVRCGKWRPLRYGPQLLKEDYFCDDWNCQMNTEPAKQSCDEPEEFEKIPMGELKKIIETNFEEQESRIENKQMASQKMMQQKQFYSQLNQKKATRSSASISNVDFEPDESSVMSLPVTSSNKRRLPTSDSSHSIKAAHLSESTNSNSNSIHSSWSTSVVSAAKTTASAAKTAAKKPAKKPRVSAGSDDERNDPTYTRPAGMSNNTRTSTVANAIEESVNGFTFDNSDSTSTPFMQTAPHVALGIYNTTNNSHMDSTLPNLQMDSSKVTVKCEPAVECTSTEGEIVRALSKQNGNAVQGEINGGKENEGQEQLDTMTRRFKDTLIGVARLIDEDSIREEIEASDQKMLLSFDLNELFEYFSEKMKEKAENAANKVKSAVISKLEGAESCELKEDLLSFVKNLK